MRKVLLLLAVCFFLYLPVGSAELYQNRDYNFQLDIPDGWVDFGYHNEYTVSRIIKRKVGGKEYFASFSLKVSPDPCLPSGCTLKNVSIAEKKVMLDEILKAAKDKYPTSYVTYSDFIEIGHNTAGIAKVKFKDSPIILDSVMIMFNRTDYYFELIFYDDDKGIYEQQFMEMLKTLKPIY